MHEASLEMMRGFRPAIDAGSTVLDVGGADINGSYREIFADCRYTSLDRKGADINVDGYDWPIADGAFDAVISGQALEHDPEFWTTTREMARVLRPGGALVIIVPSSGGVHRHPLDCWRFYPDSMKAIALWAGLELVSTKSSKESKWRDLGGLFRKPSK